MTEREADIRRYIESVNLGEGRYPYQADSERAFLLGLIDDLRECVIALADDDWPFKPVSYQEKWLKRAKELCPGKN